MREQYLINEISALLKSYSKFEQIQGSKFNVFQVLNVTSNEVRTHSKFLAELLNPSGSHGMGSIFLSNFIEQFAPFQTMDHHISKIHEFDAKTAVVYVEYYVGQKTEESGGRIDILIEDHNRNKIIIENKIYAGDQENQMIRYHNFAKKSDSLNFLLYLSLFGGDPSDYSAKSLKKDKDYLCISYSREINEWLERCAKDAFRIPYLMNAILQYAELINYLTGNTNFKQMNNEITEVILNDKNSFASAIAIANNLNNAKAKILKGFGDMLFERLINEIEDGTVYISENFGKRYEGLTIHLNRNSTPFILFSFLSDYNDCYIEIHPGHNNNNEILPKNQDLRLKYIQDLEGLSGSNIKVQNTLNSWQGEWVCHYYELNNNFEKLIENPASVLEKVVSDLLKIYAVFEKHTFKISSNEPVA